MRAQYCCQSSLASFLIIQSQYPRTDIVPTLHSPTKETCGSRACLSTRPAEERERERNGNDEDDDDDADEDEDEDEDDDDDDDDDFCHQDGHDNGFGSHVHVDDVGDCALAACRVLPVRLVSGANLSNGYNKHTSRQ